MQRESNANISPSLAQALNQHQLQKQQSVQSNQQFLGKHPRDAQSVQNELLMPQKKPKIEETEMKRYANIIQSTFPSTLNPPSKPLQYSTPSNSTMYQMPQVAPNPMSNIGNQFKYSTNYPTTRLNNLYGRYSGNYSNSASIYNQYDSIGKTPFQYLKNNPNANFNLKYGINKSNLITANQLALKNSQELGAGIQPQLGQSLQAKANVPEKAKYVIKDIPEMTVGNFLQNKGIQDMYLNNIKKTEEEINKDHFVSNNTLNAKSSTEKEDKNTITNVNIHNYNYNYNITTATGNNNIIIQTKEVEPQINSNQNPIQPVTIPNNAKKSNQEAKTAPTPSKEKKGDFPPLLQNYITRAFQRCKNNEDIEKCQKGLLKVMENTLHKGDMYTRNWNDYPLPELASTPKPQELSSHSVEHRKSHKNDSIPPSTTKTPTSGVEPIKSTHTSNNNCSNSLYQFLGSDIFEKIEAYKPIIGKCTDLEKDYYRMTDHPDTSQIRPEYILKKSLKMLIDKWKSKTADYHYISLQFRSIRQDLTVQIIQNEFSVKVYETHARIALESYDLLQFNQCQTALIPLYAMGIQGNHNEFFAYRILYTALFETIEMSKIMSLIKKKYKTRNYTSEIAYSIKVLKALNEPNHFHFLSLFTKAPNMGKYLIEPFLPRLRIKALQVIAYGYYSEIDIQVVMKRLCFKSMGECLEFLNKNHLLIKESKLLCKENILSLNTNQLLSTLIGKN